MCVCAVCVGVHACASGDSFTHTPLPPCLISRLEGLSSSLPLPAAQAPHRKLAPVTCPSCRCNPPHLCRLSFLSCSDNPAIPGPLNLSLQSPPPLSQLLLLLPEVAGLGPPSSTAFRTLESSNSDTLLPSKPPKQTQSLSRPGTGHIRLQCPDLCPVVFPPGTASFSASAGGGIPHAILSCF